VQQDFQFKHLRTLIARSFHSPFSCSKAPESWILAEAQFKHLFWEASTPLYRTSTIYLTAVEVKLYEASWAPPFLGLGSVSQISGMGLAAAAGKLNDGNISVRLRVQLPFLVLWSCHVMSGGGYISLSLLDLP
jgi:hypothetical protein